MKKKSPETNIEARYQRAQALIQGYWTRNITPNSTVYPTWIEDSDCFWYEHEINTNKGHTGAGEPLEKWDKEYRMVNAKIATNSVAFDHSVLAATLSEAAGKDVQPCQLPITGVRIQLDASDQVNAIHFHAFNKDWVYEPETSDLREILHKVISKDRLVSPDGRYAIFTRDFNLWLEDLTNGGERALTSDGEEHYCYAVTGNGWGFDMPTPDGVLVQALWSPDSKRVFTLQRDCRQVLTLPVVEHLPMDGSVRPKVKYYRTAMQGDDHVPEYRLVAIEVKTGRLQPANYRQIPIVRNSFGFFLPAWGGGVRTVGTRTLWI